LWEAVVVGGIPQLRGVVYNSIEEVRNDEKL
jgi:hypothetical protein